LTREEAIQYYLSVLDQAAVPIEVFVSRVLRGYKIEESLKEKRIKPSYLKSYITEVEKQNKPKQKEITREERQIKFYIENDLSLPKKYMKYAKEHGMIIN